MSNASQRRAVKAYRERLSEKGLRRYEVLGLEKDRHLVRSIARRLAENDVEAKRLRADLTRSVAGESTRGGLWAALRRSPLVGADIEFKREKSPGRDVKL